MTGGDTSMRSLDRLLQDIRALSKQVRRFAERVHEHTAETHRLAELAREETGRSRELSLAGRREAQSVQGSIELTRGPQTAPATPSPARES
jgi:hypothetical protein